MQSFSTVISEPKQVYWLYTLALAAGLFWLKMPVMATLLLTCWTVLSIGKTVLEVNASTRSYRSGLQILGMHLSGWQLLPPRAERVVVRYFSAYSISGTDGGGEEANRYEEYIVLLSLPSTAEGFIIYRDYDQQRAVDIAKQLGNAMHLDVVEVNRHKQQQVLQEAEPQEGSC